MALPPAAVGMIETEHHAVDATVLKIPKNARLQGDPDTAASCQSPTPSGISTQE